MANVQKGAALYSGRVSVPAQLDEAQDQEPEGVPPPGPGGPAEEVELVVVPHVKLVVEGAGARQPDKVAGEQGDE